MWTTYPLLVLSATVVTCFIMDGMAAPAIDHSGSIMEKRNMAYLARGNSMPKSLAKSLTMQYGTYNHRVQGRNSNGPDIMEKRNMAHLARSNSMPKSLANSLTMQYGTYNHRVQGRNWNGPGYDAPSEKRFVGLQRALAQIQGNEDAEAFDPSWITDRR